MNIVHICKRFYPDIGGVQTHVFEVATEQIKRKHSVTIITQAADSSQKASEISNGITVIRLPSSTGENKKKVWAAIGKHRNLLKKADVVQVHDVFWWLLPHYLLIVGKCFTTFHGWETTFPIPLTAKVQRFFYALLSKKTVHIGSWIQKYYWDTPSIVLYGGVNIPQNIQTHSQKLKNGVFLGRLSHDNDIEKYIFLTKILKEEFPGFTMIWLGDGEFKSACKEVGRVIGFTKDLAKYLFDADVVCAASYLSILQAQAYGKPVVSLFSNKLKEDYLQALPTRLSLICREQAVDAYAELALLFDEPSRVKRVSETATRLASQLTWGKVVDAYESLWLKK